MDDAIAERAKVVAWLRSRQATEPPASAKDLAPDVLCEIALKVAADAIERGDHDAIAIPRLSGDQGVK